MPGATWLALHGFAAFRLIGNTNRPQATGWDTTRNAFTWPMWQPPHSTAALTALLEHPIVRARNPETARLENFGVTALYAAGRTRLSHGDGPLELVL
ncbi:hypothetical protein OG311_09140 [Streptomyces sp. NBC_01343]|uniref:type I-G CRISPR-associated protein, Cas3-extension family n=1 Tax=Streptomyces sp. NBC_01343 TaxID=2903832 RepID=UPI002E0E887A|nr:hypothetical protein OG311_09140 [Streptomyces sp. NBC_01343]